MTVFNESKRPEEEEKVAEEEVRKKALIDTISGRCVDASNACNMGIVIDSASSLVRTMRAIPGLELIVLIPEMLIYFFKSLYHLSFLVYAKLFKKQDWVVEKKLENDVDLVEGESKLFVGLDNDQVSYMAFGMKGPQHIALSEFGVDSLDALLAEDHLKEKLLSIARRRGHIQQEVFEYRKFGWHKYQSYADFVCLTLFVMTIVLFAGVITTSPIGATLGWLAGLTGVGLNIYFDYVYQTKQAKACLEAAKEKFREYSEAITKGGACEEVKEAYEEARVNYQAIKKEYEYYKVSAHLYTALLVGLVFTFVCGSVVAFAPISLVPVFLGLKYSGIGVLIAVNLSRLVNHFKPEWKNKVFSFFGQAPKEDDAALLALSQNDKDLSSSKSTSVIARGLFKKPVANIGEGSTLFCPENGK